MQWEGTDKKNALGVDPSVSVCAQLTEMVAALGDAAAAVARASFHSAESTEK